jgi:curli production assembly/transport component CsgG
MNKFFFAGAAALLASACAIVPDNPPLGDPPKIGMTTPTLSKLRALPPPVRKIPVAVYEFRDQTGQNKPNESFPEYSRAVTQGGASILINALKEANNWFTVIDRQSLSNLLQERTIVRSIRDEYRRNDGSLLPMVGPLTFAEIMFDGGIVAYDTNTLTGGLGARFLGVGANTEYRQDSVTVYLRATAISTGEVLQSVSVSKTIYSTAVQGGVFRFVSYQRLLEAETGITANEPVHLAVKQAIEKAVYAMVMEGVFGSLWGFRGEPNELQKLYDDYVRDRDGEIQPVPEPQTPTPPPIS